MSLHDDLHTQLDAAPAGASTVSAEGPQGRAVVELEDLDRLGARVRRMRVEPTRAASIPDQVAGAVGLRGLPERLVVVEVDEGLGGGVVRSDPRDMRGKRYFEVGVDGVGGSVERFRALPEGGRETEPFTVTREQLGRLVEELAGALSEDER
jgi:hypothetical protein